MAAADAAIAAKCKVRPEHVAKVRAAACIDEAPLGPDGETRAHDRASALEHLAAVAMADHVKGDALARSAARCQSGIRAGEGGYLAMTGDDGFVFVRRDEDLADLGELPTVIDLRALRVAAEAVLRMTDEEGAQCPTESSPEPSPPADAKPAADGDSGPTSDGAPAKRRRGKKSSKA